LSGNKDSCLLDFMICSVALRSCPTAQQSGQPATIAARSRPGTRACRACKTNAVAAVSFFCKRDSKRSTPEVAGLVRIAALYKCGGFGATSPSRVGGVLENSLKKKTLRFKARAISHPYRHVALVRLRSTADALPHPSAQGKPAEKMRPHQTRTRMLQSCQQQQQETACLATE
jgi:hypothetical protein